ncbi:immunoglobulin-like domain-containing protein [Listeria booriae]|nr:immunoglobulin-like domain-containing protein [Listeria booriae]STY41540.1 C protein alpha-antigen precursor [Listeria booriae]
MNIKKIGIATTALLLCANLPMQTHAMAAESKQVYATKAESKLKSSQEEGQGSFSDVTDYFSVVPGKSSSIEKNIVTITPNRPSQAGGLWSDASNKVDLTKNFHLKADLFMGTDSNGADGMAFVMQNDPRGNKAIAGNGGAMGLYGDSYIKNALAVEIDTYINDGTEFAEKWDYDVKPKNEHIAITVPGVGPIIEHNALNVLPNGTYFEDSEFHEVSFDWNAATRTLSYNYRGYTGSYQVQSLQDTFGGNEVFFGFVGSTGQRSNLQQLKITELQINGISPELALEINDTKGNNNGKAEPSETVSVKNTISNATDDATAFKMEYGVDMDALFDADTVSNIVLTRNDGQTYTVTKEQLLNHQVELPFDSPTNTFTLTYDVQVKADASPKGTMMKVSGVGKVNGVKYTSENSITLAIPGDAPVITASDKTLKKGGSFDPMTGVSASDTEDGDVTGNITVTANDVNVNQEGTYHVTYSVTDSDDNTTTKTITVTVTSNDAPVITAADKTVKKGASFDPMAGVSASDTEDGNVTDKVTVTANDVDTSAVGTYHVTYSVTDSDGNTTTKTVTVTVTSNDAPVITASDKTLKKGASFDPMVGVTASDVEDGNVTDKVTVTANDVDTSVVGTYHVTYSVTDSDGNTTTKTITVTVTSNDAPVITASDKTLKKGGSFDPMAGVSASDTEDGNVTSSVSVTANDVDTSAVGTYHVTYSVTDSDGNTTTKTITVTVTSNDAPVIVASDQTIKKGKAFDVMAGVSASDLEDGDVTSGITVTANDVDTNTVGTYHVTYSVTDSDGNTTTKTITVTITSNDAPTFTTSDVYLKVGDKFNPYAGITASDTEDGDLTDRIDIDSSNVDMTQAGTYAVEYSVTDSDNNTTKITRHVYVRTNDKPVIHASDQTFKAGASFNPLAGMSASDTEDGDITANVTITANDVDANQAGTYHVTYSVTDSDDNTTTKTITITVLTNEKPVITATDITQKAHRSVDPMAGVTASDLEDGDLTANIKIIANDINIDVPGDYHVTYSVLDSDGNETEKTITVTILSNDAPVIHGQDVTFKAGKAFDPMAGITASDTEDGDITSAIEMTANDVNPDVAGVYHVTYSVTDSDGNTTEATYAVTVLTNEKPVIHATDQTLAYGQAFDPMAGVTAEDLEDGDLTGSIKIIANDVNPLQAGIYHVTYSVTDADGNETQITITVLVGAQPVDPVIPAAPETPMQVVPAPVTPAPVQVADPIISSVSDPVQELPKTGDTTTGNTILFGGLFAALGAFLLRRKK